MKKINLLFTFLFLLLAFTGRASSPSSMPQTHFRTISTFPFTEGFEGTWLPEGWTYIDGEVNSYWNRSTIQSNSGNAAARSYSGSNSDFLADEWLITPAFDLGQDQAHLFSFFGYTHQAPDGSREKMSVWILDQLYDNAADLHSNATLLETFSFNQTWEEFLIDLRDFDGIKYLAFHYHLTAEDNAQANLIYIDDVMLDVIPDYQASVVNNSGEPMVNSGEDFIFDITLTNSGRFDDTYSISIAGDPQWSWQVFEKGSTTPLNSVLLPASTSIDLDLKVSVPESALLGSVDSAVLSFFSQSEPDMELLLPITAIAYSPMQSGHFEDFNQATVPQLPIGWTGIVHDAATSARIETLTAGNPISLPQHVRLYNNNQAGSVVILSTPQANQLNENRIRFWTKCNNTSNVPDLIIGTMSDPEDHTTFEAFFTIDASEITDEYQEFIVPFNSYNGTNQHIAFKHGITPSFYRSLYIDNFTYEEIPESAIFTATPDNLDFGQEGTGIPTQPQLITIGNEGLAPLDITSVTLTGDDSQHFVITQTAPAFPATVQAGQTLELMVAFAPETAGTKQASLEITYEDGQSNTHLIPLSGEGIIRPEGSTCHNPVVATLPIENLETNLVSFGNDYQGDWVNPSTDYLDGYDKIFAFTLENESYLNGSAITTISQHMGIIIVDACPDSQNPANVIASGTGLRGGSFGEVPLQPGTYYAIVSTRPTTNSPINAVVNLSARTAGDPQLTATPQAFDFGMVVINESETSTLSLKNTGGGILSIESITIMGNDASDFSINDDPSPIALEIGQEVSTSLVFQPTQTGSKTATLTITYNAGTTQTLDILVSGEAFNPDSPITTLPYLEGFEEEFPPLGWTYVDGDLGSYWQKSSIQSYEGNFAARSYNGSSSNNLADEWLITRAVDLDAFPGVLLSFFAYNNSNPNGVNERLNIWLLDQPYDNAAQLRENGQLLETLMLERQWLEYNIDLRDHSGIKYVAFNYHITPEDNASLNYVYIDEVSFTEIPAYELQVMNTSGDHLVNAGASQRYEVMITNSGINDDTYNLSVSGETTWQYSILEHGTDNVISSMAVEASESILVDLKVQVPNDAEVGEQSTVNLVATSQADTSVTRQQEITTTAFRPLTALHQENFDSVSTPDLPLGWSAIVEHPTSSSPAVETLTAGTPYSAPNHVRLYSNNVEEAQILLITPEIESINHNLIRFQSKCNSSTNIPDLIIGTVTDPTDASTFTPFQTIDAEQLTDQYQEFVVEFNQYEGQDRFIGFKHGGTPSFFRSIFIDDFSLELNIDLLTVSFAVTGQDQQPLEGASVSLASYGELVTDSDGLAVFTDVFPNEDLEYVITKSEYHSVSGSINSGDENQQIDIAMDRITWTVTFIVTCETSGLIDDAVINIFDQDYAPGHYSFEDVLPGIYPYSISREGYISHNGSVTVSNEDIYVAVALTLEEFTVDFLVTETSQQASPIEGASITISGVEGIIYTGSTGEASVLLTMGSYSADIVKEGYHDTDISFTVENSDLSLGVSLSDIIITPENLAVTTNGLEPGEALFSWNNNAEGWTQGFEGDFPPQGWSQIITNTNSKPLGACTWHKTGTVTYQSTQIVPVEGDYQAFMLWDLYEQDEWLITPEFTAPVGELVFWYYGTNGSTNGDNYYVKVSTDEGQNWTAIWNASDLPAGPNHYEYPAVIDISEYAGQDIIIAWNNVAENGLWYDWAIDNISVGGIKISLDDLISFQGNNSSINQMTDHTSRAQVQINSPDREVIDQHLRNLKVFTGYNVYLSDMENPLATDVSDESYLFSQLEAGDYIAGVQSAYTTGTSEIVTIQFTIEEEEELYTVSFTVKGEEGEDITDAVITFDSTTNDAGNYVFYEIPEGEYTYSIVANGYHPAEHQTANISSDTQIDAILQPVIETFTVTFSIKDTEGDLIQDAVISFDGVTYEPGAYVFGDLTAGAYPYTLSREGYSEISGIAEVTDQDLLIDITMEADGVFTGNVQENSLTIYPNPSPGNVNVNSSHQINQLQVLDITGQVVYSATPSGMMISVDLSHLKNGIYFIRIGTSQGMHTQRVQILP